MQAPLLTPTKRMNRSLSCRTVAASLAMGAVFPVRVVPVSCLEINRMWESKKRGHFRAVHTIIRRMFDLLNSPMLGAMSNLKTAHRTYRKSPLPMNPFKGLAKRDLI